MIAVLKLSGKQPVESEILMTLVMTGARIVEHLLSREVGRGSRWHCLSGEDNINFVTSSTVAGLKVNRGGGGVVGSISIVDPELIVDRRLEILSEKYLQNVSGKQGSGRVGSEVAVLRWRSSLIVFQRLRGWLLLEVTLSW